MRDDSEEGRRGGERREIGWFSTYCTFFITFWLLFFVELCLLACFLPYSQINCEVSIFANPHTEDELLLPRVDISMRTQLSRRCHKVEPRTVECHSPNKVHIQPATTKVQLPVPVPVQYLAVYTVRVPYTRTIGSTR